MKYKFSFLQKIPYYVSTFGALFVTAMFIVLTGFKNCIYIGFLLSLPFIGIFIFFFVRFSFVLSWVEVQEEGIFVCSKKGRILRSIAWENVQKAVVSQNPQNPSAQYLCVSVNPKLSPIHTHMPGIVWAIYYDSQTISFPSNNEIVLFCSYKLKKNGHTIEFTGLGRQCNSEEMQKLRQINDRRYRIILLIMLFICAILIGWILPKL